MWTVITEADPASEILLWEEIGREMPLIGENYYRNCMDDAILSVKRIAALCEENDINLIVFTNPIYYTTYQESKNLGYDVLLEWLSDPVDYYNFSGVNDITTNRNNYYEASHYTEDIGDMIIDRIFNGVTDEKLESQGFGFYVSSMGR